jgi:hypothetical protein
MPVAAASASPLMWIAAALAAATALAWLLRRPAQAAWPRIGFGIALLVFCAALALQLAVDLGSGHSSATAPASRHQRRVAGWPAHDGGVLSGRARRQVAGARGSCAADR